MNSRQRVALSEVENKSLGQIHADTACTWAYRAWAARELGHIMLEVDFEHEAVEHAALADHYGDGGQDSLVRVRRIIAGDL